MGGYLAIGDRVPDPERSPLAVPVSDGTEAPLRRTRCPRAASLADDR